MLFVSLFILLVVGAAVAVVVTGCFQPLLMRATLEPVTFWDRFWDRLWGLHCSFHVFLCDTKRLFRGDDLPYYSPYLRSRRIWLRVFQFIIRNVLVSPSGCSWNTWLTTRADRIRGIVWLLCSRCPAAKRERSEVFGPVYRWLRKRGASLKLVRVRVRSWIRVRVLQRFFSEYCIASGVASFPRLIRERIKDRLTLQVVGTVLFWFVVGALFLGVLYYGLLISGGAVMASIGFLPAVRKVGDPCNTIEYRLQLQTEAEEARFIDAFWDSEDFELNEDDFETLTAIEDIEAEVESEPAGYSIPEPYNSVPQLPF